MLHHVATISEIVAIGHVCYLELYDTLWIQSHTDCSHTEVSYCSTETMKVNMSHFFPVKSSIILNISVVWQLYTLKILDWKEIISDRKG